MMLEYPDAVERRQRLADLKGIEDRVWVRIDGCDSVFAIADEDLERENDEKTSSVHFVRFELSPRMAALLKQGAGLTVGVDHPQYQATEQVASEIRQSLAGDLS